MPPPDGGEVQAIGRALAEELPAQRWFGGKARKISSHQILDFGECSAGGRRFLLPIIRISFEEGGTEDYFIPLRRLEGDDRESGGISVTLDIPGGSARYSDALHDIEFIRLIFSMLSGGGRIEMHHGEIRAERAEGFHGSLSASPSISKVVSSEQSNTSVILDGRTIYKSYRRLESGENPDYEVAAVLTSRTQFRSIPAPLGKLAYHGKSTSLLGSLSVFIRNEGDCWSYVTGMLSDHFLGGTAPPDDFIENLGRTTSAMHNALSSVGGIAGFAPLPIGEEDVLRWKGDYRELLAGALLSLERHMPDMGRSAAEAGQAVMEKRRRLFDAGAAAGNLLGRGIHRIRIHGDYHLGQVLKSGNELYVIDFEGEPMRSLEYRRSPHCALRDVSGMLRSLDYASAFAARRSGTGGAAAEKWSADASSLFLESYWKGYIPSSEYLPADFGEMKEALRFFTIEKAVYELNYELNNRPEWVEIPLNALARLSGPAAQTINKDRI